MGSIQSQQQQFSQILPSVGQRNLAQATPIVNHEDTKLNILDAKEIDLELFKSLPNFDDNQA